MHGHFPFLDEGAVQLTLLKTPVNLCAEDGPLQLGMLSTELLGLVSSVAFELWWTALTW